MKCVLLVDMKRRSTQPVEETEKIQRDEAKETFFFNYHKAKL